MGNITATRIFKKLGLGCLIFVIFGVGLMILAILGGYGLFYEDRVVVKDFYKNQFKEYTLIDDLELNMACEKDKIREMVNGDFDATCIFKLSQNQATIIESRLNLNPNMRKENLDKIEESLYFVNELECYKNIKFSNYGYVSELDVTFHGYSYYIFSKNKDYLLFYIKHF